jgi:hypothetical protein
MKGVGIRASGVQSSVTLARRGAGTPVSSGTTWAALTSAVDGTPPANPATYATWTNAVSSAVGYIEVSGYDFSSIPAGSTITSVTVTLRHLENNTGRFTSVVWQVYDGATTIGAAQTCTLATGARDDAAVRTPTLAQLQSATFKVRATATGAANTQSRIFSVDHIDVTVVYTAP